MEAKIIRYSKKDHGQHRFGDPEITYAENFMRNSGNDKCPGGKYSNNGWYPENDGCFKIDFPAFVFGKNPDQAGCTNNKKGIGRCQHRVYSKKVHQHRYSEDGTTAANKPKRNTNDKGGDIADYLHANNFVQD